MTSHLLCPTLCPSHQGLVKSGVYVPPTLGFVHADRCAQYVDEFGRAAHTPEEFITNLELVFQQLDKAGLKLRMGKMTDKGTAFTAELLTELAKAADIHISQATIKHAQTIDMVASSRVDWKKILKFSVNADRTQWDC